MISYIITSMRLMLAGSYTTNIQPGDEEHDNRKKNHSSPAGNRTRVFHVTGGDTYHYTTEEWIHGCTQNIVLNTIIGMTMHNI